MPAALIVDDSAAVRHLVTELLSEHGWSTVACASAEEGAARALSTHFDAVVSDLWMPGTSGLQMCRLLRNDPFTADIPIILITASSDRRTRFWAQLSGATSFLEKRAIRELPALLAQSRGHRALSKVLPKPVDEAKIPARLGHLLDQNLFAAEISSRVRGLALEHTDVAGLFRGLADLLSAIMEYRWLALSVIADGATSLLVHAGTVDLVGVEEATRALGGYERIQPVVISDERCVVTQRADPPVERLIEHGGKPIGRIAISLADAKPQGHDFAAFELVAREIALPLRLSALLESMQRCAMTDELTGLPNRRGGMGGLERAVAGAERQQQPLSVVLVDIDHFKAVNDTHGHSAGDATLRHVGAILERCARRSDLVSRWGGEEFLLVLPSTDQLGARTLADRLRNAVSLAKVTLERGVRVDITVSAGVATLGMESSTDLVNRAERALYAAKRAGRNIVESADDAAPRMRTAARRPVRGEV